MTGINNEILWLPGWYPNKLDAFTGDFIQRQAMALSLYCHVHVVFIIRDTDALITKTIKIEEFKKDNLTETIIYYHSGNSFINAIDKILSFLTYNLVFKQYFSDYIRNSGNPRFAHVHVPYKAGLIALWLKKKYGISYYVTEHWTGYDRRSSDNYFNRPGSFRRIVSKTLKESLCVCPVSLDLAEKLKQIQPSIKTKVISNVVDEKQFYYSPVATEPFRFIHYVSSWKGQKNSEGLLKVLLKLANIRQDWKCIMYGPPGKEIIELVNKLNLNDKIEFTGEISYAAVSGLVRSASALVSFSNYENQPCSILEALSCGVPVIATRVGGIPEIVNADNGILVEPGNEDQLLEAFRFLLDNYPSFDRSKIADEAMNKFSYHRVGRQLAELYNEKSTF